MKKLLLLAMSAFIGLSLSACSSDTQAGTTAVPETAMVTVTTQNGAREEIEIEVPFDPQRIAVLDLAVLDILDNLGMGDRVVGVSKGSSIDYLQSYVTDDAIVNLGTIKEASLEAVMACEPDVIFIGGRLSSQYDALSQIAPVIFVSTDVTDGVVKSTQDNAMMIASLFGAEEKVMELLNVYEGRIQELAAFAEGKTAVVGMVNNGGFGVLGNDGRCSIIGVEIGFENMSDSDVTSTHGNESSFELLVEIDPDYVFVMDRDAAIGTEGAQLAREVMENELVVMTAAYQEGNIVYLAHSNVWYTAEGGITALGMMLSDLEAGLFN